MSSSLSDRYRIRLQNSHPFPITCFIQGDNIDAVYLRTIASKRTNIVGDLRFDCSARLANIPDPRRYPGPSATPTLTTTLFIELASLEYQELGFGSSGWSSDIKVWSAPYGLRPGATPGTNPWYDAAIFRTPASQKPDKLSSVRVGALNHLRDTFPVTVSFAEAVSCGIQLDVLANTSPMIQFRISAEPDTPGAALPIVPPTLLIEPAIYRILPPKYTETAALNVFLAQAPPALTNNACGLHRCLVYYTALEQPSGPLNYVRWLRTPGFPPVELWPFDDIRCLNNTCGYRGATAGEPDQLTNSGLGSNLITSGPGIDGCTVPVPSGAGNSRLDVEWWNVRDYAAGYRESLPIPINGSVPPTPGPTSWWSAGYGSELRLVGGRPIHQNIPQPPTLRDSVSLVITFSNLAWLSGVPSPSATISGVSPSINTNNVIIPWSTTPVPGTTKPISNWNWAILVLMFILLVLGFIAFFVWSGIKIRRASQKSANI